MELWKNGTTDGTGQLVYREAASAGPILITLQLGGAISRTTIIKIEVKLPSSCFLFSFGREIAKGTKID